MSGKSVIPGKAIYGEEWFRQISQDKSRKVYIIEAHEGLAGAIAFQKSVGQTNLVIAINNPARITEGCDRCSAGWHKRFEDNEQ